MVDQPSLPFRRRRIAHFGDNVVERFGIGADRAGERIAAERAEANLFHARCFAGTQRQAVVIHHDQRSVALDHRPLLGEIKRHDRDRFRRGIIPHVALRPIRQRKDAHRFARLDPRVEQPPELGALVARVPGMRRRAVRKNPLLGAALFLVAAGAAKGGVETVFVERLAQGLGLHNLRMQCRTGGDWRDAPLQPVLVGINEDLDAKTRRGGIAKGDHVPEFPGRIYVQQGKWKFAGVKRLLGDMEHRARILADRIEQHRALELGHHLAHDEDRLGFELAEMRGEGLIHRQFPADPPFYIRPAIIRWCRPAQCVSSTSNSKP